MESKEWVWDNGKLVEKDIEGNERLENETKKVRRS